MGTNISFDIIQTNFQVGLINGSRPFKNDNTKNIGYWFHYTKAFYSRLKITNLFSKSNFVINKVLLNTLKYLPFLLADKKNI